MPVAVFVPASILITARTLLLHTQESNGTAESIAACLGNGANCVLPLRVSTNLPGGLVEGFQGGAPYPRDEQEAVWLHGVLRERWNRRPDTPVSDRDETYPTSRSAREGVARGAFLTGWVRRSSRQGVGRSRNTLRDNGIGHISIEK
ncbi:hypothetical protein [Nocardia fluminea]|uniref:hypothetical protein n=1 Tax=Nocardia fluminea TaxID=134984 RepID=UPI003404AC0E